MAGSNKPNSNAVESSYSYGTVANTDYVLEGTTIKGLFDGVRSDDWNTSNVAYFNNAQCYVIVTINENSVFWRSGTTGWKEKCGKFKIYKYNEATGDFDIDMSSYSLNPTQITEEEWEKFTDVLPPGKYKFTGAIRIDSEWFIEKSFTPNFLIYNEKYYIPTAEHYNITTHMFNDVSLDDVKSSDVLIDLLSSLTIDDDTFTILDKFREYPIQIGFKSEASDVKVAIYKSDSELIVGSGDIDISVAKNIDYFKFNYDKINDNTVFIICSTDKGNTWLTYDFDNSVFSLLEDIKIPKVSSYSDMTVEQKNDYENSKPIIIKNGIPIDSFEMVDWNALDSFKNNDSKIIRFAYCITKSEYKDKTSIKSLDCQFDAFGYFKKTKESECDININKNNIEVCSLIDTDIMKINII